MKTVVIDKFWHRTLRRPFRLSKVFDKGEGPPVVLLHGLGRTGNGWKHVIELLVPYGFRAVAFDLLGFGASPKPQWLRYDIDDHASAVISAIQRLRLGEPAVLVGHSMGCLVALRVARRRPDLVRHMVLYEMPLYEGLPRKKIYQLRVNLYFKIYKQILKVRPIFDPTKQRRLERLASKMLDYEITKDGWTPFVRSLENTIMKQTAPDDIKQLKMAVDVIYGSLDMLVIRGKPQAFFGDASSHITTHTIRVSHVISLKGSQFIVSRIQAALGQNVVG